MPTTPPPPNWPTRCSAWPTNLSASDTTSLRFKLGHLRPHEQPAPFADALRAGATHRRGPGARGRRGQRQAPLGEAAFKTALTAENMVLASLGLDGPQPAEVARMLGVQCQQLAQDVAWVVAAKGKLTARGTCWQVSSAGYARCLESCIGRPTVLPPAHLIAKWHRWVLACSEHSLSAAQLSSLRAAELHHALGPDLGRRRHRSGCCGFRGAAPARLRRT